MLIVTPGRLLNALNEMSLLSFTPSNIVPSAVTRSASVEIVHVKSALWSKNVANSVNWSLSVILRVALVSESRTPSLAAAQTGMTIE